MNLELRKLSIEQIKDALTCPSQKLLLDWVLGSEAATVIGEASAAQELKRTREKLEAAQTDIESLSVSVRELITERDEARAQLELVSDDKRDLFDANHKLDEEIDRVTKENEELKAKLSGEDADLGGGALRLSQQNDDLFVKLQAALDNVSDLKRRLGKAEESAGTWKERFEGADRMKRAAEERESNALRENESLLAQIKRLGQQRWPCPGDKPEEAPAAATFPEVDQAHKPVPPPLTNDIVAAGMNREAPTGPITPVAKNPLPEPPIFPPNILPWTAIYSGAQALMVLQVYADGGDFHLAACKASVLGPVTMTEAQAKGICTNYYAAHAEYLRQAKRQGEEALYNAHLGRIHGYVTKRERLAEAA